MVEIFVAGKGWSSLFADDSKNSAESLPPDIESLVRLKDELEKRKFHLDRSNQEMETFDPAGEDAELQDAIKENKKILVETDGRLDLLNTKIKELGGMPTTKKDETAPTTTNDSIDAFRSNTVCEDVVDEAGGVSL